jgi:hypothetical protein
MGGVGESEDQAISAAVAEYKRYSAGELRRRVVSLEVKAGTTQLCGDDDDEEGWTLAYVRGDNDAVVPLALGNVEHVVSVDRQLVERRAKIWDPERFPPPVAVLGDRRHYFRPAHGRVLVGVVQVGARTVLLAAIGEKLGVIHLVGKTATLVHVGRVLSFSEVDVDAALRRHRRPTMGGRPSEPAEPAAPAPVRPSAAIQAEHLRIIYGRRVDTNGGPLIAHVIRRCFTDVVKRALALRSTTDKEFKGKTKVRRFVDFLFRLYLAGCGDLVGRIGQIIEQIQEHCPDFDMTPEALADVLGLLLASGTCLIAPRGPRVRIWQINLAGLGNPQSRIHRRLCKETVGLACASEAANERPSLVVVSDPRPSDGAGSPEPQAQAPATPAPTPGPAGGDGVVPQEHAVPTLAVDGDDPIRDEPTAPTTDDLVAALVKQLVRVPVALQRLLLASIIVLGLPPPGVASGSTPVSSTADMVEAEDSACAEPAPTPPVVDVVVDNPDEFVGPSPAPEHDGAAGPAPAAPGPETPPVPGGAVPLTRGRHGLTQVFELGRHLLLSRGSPGARPSLVIAGRLWTAEGPRGDVRSPAILRPGVSRNLTTVHDALALLAGKAGGTLGPRGPPTQRGLGARPSET